MSQSETQSLRHAGHTAGATTLDAKTRRLVEKTIDRINALVAEAGGRHDAVADHVFRTFFDGDVQTALEAARPAPAGFEALLEAADGPLRLGRTQLFCAVRVGALNTRLAGSAWDDLAWSIKVDLLRALGPDRSIDRVAQGAAYALQTRASVREVREWVADRLSGATEQGEALSKGPTFIAGRKAVRVGAAITRASDRRRWVDRALKMDESELAAYRRTVKAAARNLGKLAEDLDAALDDT